MPKYDLSNIPPIPPAKYRSGGGEDHIREIDKIISEAKKKIERQLGGR